MYFDTDHQYLIRLKIDTDCKHWTLKRVWYNKFSTDISIFLYFKLNSISYDISYND